MERFIGQLEKCCSQSAGHFVVAKQATQNSRVAINYHQNVSNLIILAWREWDISIHYLCLSHCFCTILCYNFRHNTYSWTKRDKTPKVTKLLQNVSWPFSKEQPPNNCKFIVYHSSIWHLRSLYFMYFIASYNFICLFPLSWRHFLV